MGETRCYHDWRVNPFVQLLVYPPRRQLVCALCGDVKLETVKMRNPDREDPRTWPKA